MGKALRQQSVERRLRPRLENGDQLEADDFLDLYEALPTVRKAELIEREVHVPSPVGIDTHGEPQFLLMAWLGNYAAFTPGVRGADNTTVRLSPESVPQPDALLFLPGPGGEGRVGEDGYLVGAPEFVAEIASSRVSIDVGRKKKMYQKHRVPEYLVWRVEDEAIDWFQLRRTGYALLRENKGILKSEVFPGLWLNVPAMLKGDLKTVFETLQQGIATADHAEFVRRLKR
jgi:Uma2 family endonuclease